MTKKVNISRDVTFAEDEEWQWNAATEMDSKKWYIYVLNDDVEDGVTLEAPAVQPGCNSTWSCNSSCNYDGATKKAATTITCISSRLCSKSWWWSWWQWRFGSLCFFLQNQNLWDLPMSFNTPNGKRLWMKNWWWLRKTILWLKLGKWFE